MDNTKETAPSKGDILPCSTIVLRAALKAGWVDKEHGKVMPAAFFLRAKPNDEDGISVGHSCDLNSHLSQFNKTYGAATLHVGRIRDIGLDVIRGGPNDPSHAVITGVPYREDDPLRAESLALQLARQARLAGSQP